MSTIPCTIEQFNKAFCEFNEAAGLKTNTQDGIANMHKGLVLHYLGIEKATDEDIERSARCLHIATSGAIRRGWHLSVPDLSINLN